MLVQDLLSRLSYGELSSLSIGMEGAGQIAPDDEDKVLSAVSLALTALYTRFQLRVSSLVLEATAGVSTYVLDAVHAESNTDPDHTEPRYIKDVSEMSEPFLNDIIRILSVVRCDNSETLFEDESQIFSINARRSVSGAAKIIAYNEIRLTTTTPGERFVIEYQAKHKPLTLNGSITIMPALEEALQARTAAALFSGMAGDAHTARAAEHLARYERLCEMASIGDMAQESSTDQFDRLRDKGFV